MEWLNENQGAIVGIGTLALVIVTAVYVFVTHRLLQETRTSVLGAHLQVYRPSLSLDAPEPYLHVFGHNIGNASALDLAWNAKIEGRDLTLLSGDQTAAGLARMQASPPQPQGIRASLMDFGPRATFGANFRLPDDWRSLPRECEVRVVCRWTDATGRREASRSDRLSFSVPEDDK